MRHYTALREAAGGRGDGGGAEVMGDPRHVVMLEDNYRAHADLLTIPSRLFYHGKLKERGDRSVTHSLLAWERLPQERSSPRLLFLGLLVSFSLAFCVSPLSSSLSCMHSLLMTMQRSIALLHACRLVSELLLPLPWASLPSALLLLARPQSVPHVLLRSAGPGLGGGGLAVLLQHRRSFRCCGLDQGAGLLCRRRSFHLRHRRHCCFPPPGTPVPFPSFARCVPLGLITALIVVLIFSITPPCYLKALLSPGPPPFLHTPRPILFQSSHATTAERARHVTRVCGGAGPEASRAAA